jgi:hypothetical protein
MLVSKETGKNCEWTVEEAMKFYSDTADLSPGVFHKTIIASNNHL